jgi:excisionase family DNA binding protein
MDQEKSRQERKWLSKKEVLQYLKISQRTLENWASQGLIRTYKIGGKIFIDQFQLDQDILNSRNGSKK